MLEQDTQMELKEYRSFIDEEMITILGQMDTIISLMVLRMPGLNITTEK